MPRRVCQRCPRARAIRCLRWPALTACPLPLRSASAQLNHAPQPFINGRTARTQRCVPFFRLLLLARLIARVWADRAGRRPWPIGARSLPTAAQGGLTRPAAPTPWPTRFARLATAISPASVRLLRRLIQFDPSRTRAEGWLTVGLVHGAGRVHAAGGQAAARRGVLPPALGAGPLAPALRHAVRPPLRLADLPGRSK